MEPIDSYTFIDFSFRLGYNCIKTREKIEQQAMSQSYHYRFTALLMVGLLSLYLGGCGSQPYRPSAQTLDRQQVIEAARDMLGVPYRYGGTSPQHGFDCSGLVQYVYSQAGVQVPRTTGEQYRASLPIKRNALQPGDVNFFRSPGRRFVSHVGIYLGQGEFIHAPSSGRSVSIDSLQDDYWRRRYTSGGRMF